MSEAAQDGLRVDEADAYANWYGKRAAESVLKSTKGKLGTNDIEAIREALASWYSKETKRMLRARNEWEQADPKNRWNLRKKYRDTYLRRHEDLRDAVQKIVARALPYEGEYMPLTFIL